MEFMEWGAFDIEGEDMAEEIIIDIRYSDLVGERYEELKEKYWRKKE